MQEWTLDAWYDGQNEPSMGNEGSKMTFLMLAYYRDLERIFRVFEACLFWGNTEDRTAGNERERDRVREIPGFPKPRAQALRFGSMNPISRVSGPGSMGKMGFEPGFRLLGLP